MANCQLLIANCLLPTTGDKTSLTTTEAKFLHGAQMNASFLDLHAAADFLGPGAVEVNRYQTEITDIVRRRGVFGQRIKQVPATGHPSRFFEQTAIAIALGGQRLRRSAQHRGNRGLADPGGALRAAEGAGLADQLQPVRHRSRSAASPVRLPAGEGPGRRGRRPDAHARRRPVERQRHIADARRPRRSISARPGRSRAAATSPPSTLRTASWTG